jgi:hypothetical protein
LLNVKPSIPSVTPAIVACVARRSANASGPKLSGAAASQGAASSSIRQTRWRNRHAPSTPAAVHSTSRSGGLSDSMNQRAVSAPYCSTIRSGSTTLRLDLDILTVGPTTTGSPVARSRTVPSGPRSTSPGKSHTSRPSLSRLE